MGHTGFIINTFLEDFTPSYYFGAWDDAHTPGQFHVGLGWTLHGADCIEFGGFPKWKPLLRAYGRMPGNNATTAEIMACLSMTLTIDSWLRGQDLHSDMAHLHERIIDIEGSVTLGNTADFLDFLCEHIGHVTSDDEEDGKSTEIDSNSENDGSSS